MEREVTQTHIRWDTELLRLASNASLLMSVSEVFMPLWMRGSRFSLKRDLRVQVWFVSDDLSLVIFWTAYNWQQSISLAPKAIVSFMRDYKASCKVKYSSRHSYIGSRELIYSNLTWLFVLNMGRSGRLHPAHFK